MTEAAEIHLRAVVAGTRRRLWFALANSTHRMERAMEIAVSAYFFCGVKTMLPGAVRLN